MFHAVFNGGFLSVFTMLFLLGLALRLATDAAGRVIAFIVCSVGPFFRKVFGVIRAAFSAGKHNAKGESYLIPEGYESVDAFIKARAENGKLIEAWAKQVEMRKGPFAWTFQRDSADKIGFTLNGKSYEGQVFFRRGDGYDRVDRLEYKDEWGTARAIEGLRLNKPALDMKAYLDADESLKYLYSIQEEVFANNFAGAHLSLAKLLRQESYAAVLAKYTEADIQNAIDYLKTIFVNVEKTTQEGIIKVTGLVSDFA